MKSTLIGIGAIALCMLSFLGCEKKGSTEPVEVLGGLIVLNQGDGTVAIHDYKSLEFVRSYDAMVELPHHMEMTRSHNKFFVVGRQAPGEISKFDLETDEFLDKTIGGPATLLPTAIAVNAAGTKGYTTDFGGNPGGVYEIDLTTMSFTSTTFVSSLMLQTHDIKISASDTLLFAANFGRDNIAIIDIKASDMRFVDIGVPFAGTVAYGPYGLAIQNDSLVYIACRISHEVRVYDLYAYQIIDSIDIPISVVSPNAGPTQLMLMSNERTLFVSTWLNNTVSVIDLSGTTRTVTATIAVGAGPFGMALSDDNAKLYVACSNSGAPANPGSIYMINTLTNAVADSVAAGRQPFMVHFHEPHSGGGH